jgi:hypothetical protein
VRRCDVTCDNKSSKKGNISAYENDKIIYRGFKEYDTGFIWGQLTGWFKQTVIILTYVYRWINQMQHSARKEEGLFLILSLTHLFLRIGRRVAELPRSNNMVKRNPQEMTWNWMCS